MEASRPILILNSAEETMQVVLGAPPSSEPGGDGLAGVQRGAAPGILYSLEVRVPGRVVQFLAPAVQEALASCDLGPADLGGIACVRGPGSFTGLRLILAMALGLSRSAGVPTTGLDYLPLLAAGPAEVLRGRLLVLTHSRRRQVYLQAFDLEGGASHATGPVAAVSLEDAASAIQAAAPGPAFILGSGLRRNAEFLVPAIEAAGITVLDQAWDTPRPNALLAAALTASYSHAPVVPLYLRPSDAEENLSDIASARGLSPEEARRRLERATT